MTGEAGSQSFRVFFKEQQHEQQSNNNNNDDDDDENNVSPWHDLALKNDDGSYNMVSSHLKTPFAVYSTFFDTHPTFDFLFSCCLGC